MAKRYWKKMYFVAQIISCFHILSIFEFFKMGGFNFDFTYCHSMKDQGWATMGVRRVLLTQKYKQLLKLRVLSSA